MKFNLLSMAALAAALVPGIANADVGADQDGIGTYPIAASVPNFCKLGAVQLGAAQNIAAVSGSFSTSDASINVNLADANDHANAWTQSMVMNDSICNTDYNVIVTSDNGGLTNSTTAVAGNKFIKRTPYDVIVAFGSNYKSAKALTIQNSSAPLMSGSPTVGAFTLQFRGYADANAYLLAGDYTDVVRVTMAPRT